MITKCDLGVGGLSQRVMSHFQKSCCSKHRIQIDYCVFISTFHWHFDVVVNLDNKFCVENMHIKCTLDFNSFPAKTLSVFHV